MGSLSVKTGDAKGNAASSHIILSPASCTHMRKVLKHPVDLEVKYKEWVRKRVFLMRAVRQKVPEQGSLEI